jgi:hypothetical protein
VELSITLHTINCGMSECSILFHLISYRTRFLKKGIEHEIECFDFLYDFFVNISHSNNYLTEDTKKDRVDGKMRKKM